MAKEQPATEFLNILEEELAKFNGGSWDRLTATEQKILKDVGQYTLERMARKAKGEDVTEQVAMNRAAFEHIKSIKATQAYGEFRSAFARAVTRLRSLVLALI